MGKHSGGGTFLAMQFKTAFTEHAQCKVIVQEDGGQECFWACLDAAKGKDTLCVKIGIFSPLVPVSLSH